MGRRQQRSWFESRALIQRGRRKHLIIKTARDDERPWEFPGGRIRRTESPEAGLRRLCRALLNVELTIFVGQPPFVYRFGTHRVTYRYYVCGIRGNEPTPAGCAELRWVLTKQLCEYVFDAPTQQVVDWLQEEPLHG
jgi:ADP-ribose pyrophosphatase YjhB (NUDIX family)